MRDPLPVALQGAGILSDTAELPTALSHHFMLLAWPGLAALSAGSGYVKLHHIILHALQQSTHTCCHGHTAMACLYMHV